MEKINKIFLICFVILCLPGILSFAENMENIDNNKLSSFRLSGGNVINYALEKTGYSLEELLIKLVSCGTRIIDIVFVLDTTGSMYADLASAQANCAWFVNQLDSAGFNYAFGLVTFGDNTNFPHGYDLTNDGSLFQSWLWALSAGGGGDWRESSLDGIADAINLYNWRPYANHVVVMLTDAPFHHIGESEYSDETPEGVLNLLIETNTISDIISPNTMSSPSVPAFDYNHKTIPTI